MDAVEISIKLNEQDKDINFEGNISLKTFFALINKKTEELKDHVIATSHSELEVYYLLQIERCDSDIMRTPLDKWQTMSKRTRHWTTFKRHFSKVDT